MQRGTTTWIVSVLVGALTMLAVEWLFRFGPQRTIVPIAQAVGFIVATLVAWPWTHSQNARLTFTRYTVATVGASALIAALRIAFRTG